MNKLTLLAIIFATPTFSQDLTHPLEMGLPDSSHTRPDPAEYPLILENGLVAFVAEAKTNKKSKYCIPIHVALQLAGHV